MVRVGAAGGRAALATTRRTRGLTLSEQLPRESRGFHMAFQLMLLEARDAVEAVLDSAPPSTAEATQLVRIGLLNYAAAAAADALCRVRRSTARGAAARCRAASRMRFGVSFEQACHRLSSLQRAGAARGAVLLPAHRPGRQRHQALLPAPASRSRGSAGPARAGWCMARWPRRGLMRVQVARLPDGADLPVLRPQRDRGVASQRGASRRRCTSSPWAATWRMRGDLVYGDRHRPGVRRGRDRAVMPAVRPAGHCRSRAFPPLDHRLALDTLSASDSPYRLREGAAMMASFRLLRFYLSG